MEKFNGITIMPPSNWRAPETFFSMDSCLTACGGWCENTAFQCKFPKWIVENRNISINEKEMIAVLIAVRKWGNHNENLNILAYCDNQATCKIINRGAANNLFTQQCLRELCFIFAKHNAVIKMVYLNTKQNRISDLLSRWENIESRSQFFQLIGRETNKVLRNQ